MSDPTPNPFEPPAETAGRSSATTGSMQYFDAYQYVFRNPNWLVNLLLITVCQFIPVIGPMVTLGYQFEIIEALHRDPRRVHPDFSFDLFVDYLKRGLWPFLVTLVVFVVVSVPLTILIYIFMIIVVLSAAAVGEDGGGTAVMAIGMPLTMLAIMAVMILLGVVVMPMVLRSGLTQNFAEGFQLDFIKSFLRRTWKEMVLSALFLAVTGMLAVFAGLAVFCVGSYFAASLLMLAQAHIYFQLYQLYLTRGGQPIPLQPYTGGPPGT